MKTKGIASLVVGLVASLTLSGGSAGAGTATGPEIVDPAGDANFINGHNVFVTDPVPSTATPVEIDGADLTAIWLETTYNTVKDKDEAGTVRAVRHVPSALQITFQTKGPIRDANMGLFFQLPTVVGGCNVTFRAWLAGPTAPVTESAEINKVSAISGSACPGGTGVLTNAQFTFQVLSNRLILTYPFAALPPVNNQLYLARDVEIRPSATGPSVRPILGIVAPQLQIDTTKPFSTKFRLGSDVPADIVCTPDSAGNLPAACT